MAEERDSSPDSEPVLRRRPRPPVDLPPEEPFRRRVIPYVLALAFAALLGLGSEAIRSFEAIAAAAAFPLVVMLVGLGPLRSAPGWLSRAGIVLAVVVAMAVEVLSYREFFPAAPFARATLTPTAAEASLPVPDAEQRFEVLVQGKLLGDAGEARAAYSIDLQRNGERAKLEGEMSRHAAAPSRRMMAAPGGAAATALESGRHEVLLGGAGAISARLAHLGNGARKSLEVTIHPRPLGEREVSIGFAVLAAAGFILQAAAARKGLKSRLGGAAAVAGVFAIYLRRTLDTADPLLTVLPAMVVALVVGGLPGLLLGYVTESLAPKPVSAAPGTVGRSAKR